MQNQARHLQNIEIITQFKEGKASAEVLKAYSGWGGLREAIYTPTVYRELKQMLTHSEINLLKQTLKNAYFTPASLVKFIYDWLSVYGIKGGSILEPSIGNGVFVEHMPKAIASNSHITAVELDAVTCQMVRQLYPQVSLHNCGFEQFQPESKFDLIVGNPPYGSSRVFDEKHPDLQSFCIHHYFVAKSMRLLKEGGVLAMVLPSYFLDNEKAHVRAIIQQEGGSLLTAYRLPDDFFADAKVTVDVVFLKKGQTNKKWVDVKSVCVNGTHKPINEFFYDHSDHILGNLELVEMYGRKGLTCRRRGDTTKLLETTMEHVKRERLVTLQSKLATFDQKINALKAAKLHVANIYQEVLAL